MIVMMALIVNVSFGRHNTAEAVKVISTARDIFYFKVCESMIGASIKVYDHDGKLLVSEEVVHHKVIVDFYGEPAGNYKIVITKDNNEVSFDYSKETESHAERGALGDYISITQ